MGLSQHGVDPGVLLTFDISPLVFRRKERKVTEFKILSVWLWPQWVFTLLPMSVVDILTEEQYIEKTRMTDAHKMGMGVFGSRIFIGLINIIVPFGKEWNLAKKFGNTHNPNKYHNNSSSSIPSQYAGIKEQIGRW